MVAVDPNVLSPRFSTNKEVEWSEGQSSFGDLVKAQLGYAYDPAFEAITNTYKYYDSLDPSYKPAEDMVGYEDFRTTLINAKNSEHMQDLKRGINESRLRREIMSQHGFLAHVGAGLFDPLNLLALPFGGAGLARTVGSAAIRTGAGVAALQAGQETIRYPFDPLATASESAFNIGAAAVTGGLLGSAIKVPAALRAKAYKKTVQETEEALESLANLTGEDARNLGQREARAFGHLEDAELEIIKVNRPKEIEAAEKAIDELKAVPKKTTAQLQELKNREKGLENSKKEFQAQKNESALRRIEDSKAGKDPHSIAESWFTDSFIYNKLLPTAMKDTLQNQNIVTSVKKKFVELAGDSGITTAGNQAGLISGNSTYQFAKIRDGEWVSVMDKLITNFGKKTGKGDPLVIMDHNVGNMDGSFSRFMQDMNKKYVKGERGADDLENESIQLMADFWATWGTRLDETGLIGSKKFYKDQMVIKEEKLRKAYSEIERDNIPDDYRNALDVRISRLEEELNELDTQLKASGDDQTMPPNEEVFYSRYFNKVKIEEDRAGFFNILKQWYSDNPIVWAKGDSAPPKNQNFVDLDNGSLIARLGEDFNVRKIVEGDEAVAALRNKHPDGALGMHQYFDNEKGIVYIDKVGVRNRYFRFKEAIKDKQAAIDKNNKFGEKSNYSSPVFHHNAYMINNADKFRNFKDYQDFVLLHEFHHGTIKRKYKETEVDYEMRVNEAAMEYMTAAHVKFRARGPAWIKQELSADEVSLDSRVNDTIDNILGMADGTEDSKFFAGHGKSKHFRHRTLDIPNSLIFDYIINDPIAVMKAYTQRVGPRYEFAKMNGGKKLDDVLDDIEDEMRISGNTTKEINKARKDYIVLYDRVVGSVLREPHSWDARLATVMRDAAQLNYLGSAGFSTLPDLAKIMMEHDAEVLLKGLKSLGDAVGQGYSAKEARLAGQTLEILLGSSHMRLTEDLANNPFSNNNWDKYYSKNVDVLKNQFYKANLLAPFTRIFKQMDALVRSHTLVDLALKRANGKISKQDLAYISRYNIDDVKAKQIKELVDTGVIQRVDDQGLWMPNTEQWPVQYQSLRDDFRVSLNSGIENTILMGTPADKPTLIDGILHIPMSIAGKMGLPEDKVVRGYHRIESPLLGLPFQFMSYSFAATNKITAALAHNQVKNRAVAISASMGLAALSLYIKTPDWAWEKMTWQDVAARSFDASGLAALFSDAFYTSMSTSISLGGPDIGMGIVKPKFPPKEDVGEAVSGVLGSGASITHDFLRYGVSDFINGNYGSGSKNIIRNLPTARLWFLKDFINESTRDLEGVLDEARTGGVGRF